MDTITNKILTLTRELLPHASVPENFDEILFDNLDGWDSATHVTFIVQLEDALDITFLPEEYTAFSSLTELLKLIQNKKIDKLKNS
jgi:acyl carrier protein